MFVLHTLGGLGNRIQSIFAYRRLVVGTLDVLWEPSDAVSHGRWDDVFLPLEGVRFHDRRFGFGYGHKVLSVDHAPSESWRADVGELKPTAEVQAEIDKVLATLPLDTAAIHVRRTDYVQCAWAHGLSLPPLKDYASFAQGAEAVYLATDNAETQKKIHDLLPGSTRLVGTSPALHSTEKQAFGDDRRHTSLLEAVVDLFVCARASRFMGTPGSTFTSTIEALRAQAG